MTATENNLMRDAMMSQRACNLGGLIHGWDRAMSALQAEANALGKGTDWINRHPVNALFAEQVYFLTGSGARYADAYGAAKQAEESSA
jgi:hypothetical protein